MRLFNKILALAVCFFCFEANAATNFVVNGKTNTLWNGKTITAWNGKTNVFVGGGGGGGGNGLLTGLVAFWEMEEASGDTVDSVASLTLTDHNNVGSTIGINGNARDFEENNQTYFNTTDNATMSMGGTSFTFTCWAKWESTGAENYMTIFQKDDVGSNREYGLILDKNNTRLQFYADNGSGLDTVDFSSFTPTTGVWYFIAVWYNRDTDELGINVQQDGTPGTYNHATKQTTSKTADVTDKSAGFGIGRFQNNQFFFDGPIDDFGVWKRALSSTDIGHLFDKTPFSSFD